MNNEFSIEHLLTESLQIDKITESIFKVDNEVIEVLEINYDLKSLKIRHNHTTHHIQFKNQLDFTLDKMGIKRTFEHISTDIKAPMPGKVLQVMVKAGDVIEKGQPLLILEAMKMENVLKADAPATIKGVAVSQSQNVESGQLLIEIEAAD